MTYVPRYYRMQQSKKKTKERRADWYKKKKNISKASTYAVDVSNLKIPVKIAHNNETIEAILDTQSNLFIINKHILEEKFDLKPSFSVLKGAEGEKVRINLWQN